jgi:CDP-diglyceride synthetase
MSDIVTGVIGGALFTAFLAFILVRVADVALWIVAIVGIFCMAYALWGDAVTPYLSRRSSNG